MWIGHTKGWLSIVEHRDKPEHLLVRARKESHITTLWPEADVIMNPDADYPYRVDIKRGRVAEVMADYIKGIDYENYKRAVATEDERLGHALGWVWTVMSEYGVEYR